MFESIFKPKLLQYLSKYQLNFHVSNPSVLPAKSRAETVAVSAVLKFENATMLHCSTLIEGNN
jgi:hypothetical protein